MQIPWARYRVPAPRLRRYTTAATAAHVFDRATSNRVQCRSRQGLRVETGVVRCTIEVARCRAAGEMGSLHPCRGGRRGCEMESMGSSSADEGSDGPRFGMMTRACWLMTPRCARADDRRPIQQGRCWRSRQPTTVRRTLRIDKEVVFQCSLFCGMHRAVAQRRSGEQGTTSTRPGLPSVHGGA